MAFTYNANYFVSSSPQQTEIYELDSTPAHPSSHTPQIYELYGREISHIDPLSLPPLRNSPSLSDDSEELLPTCTNVNVETEETSLLHKQRHGPSEHEEAVKRPDPIDDDGNEEKIPVDITSLSGFIPQTSFAETAEPVEQLLSGFLPQTQSAATSISPKQQIVMETPIEDGTKSKSYYFPPDPDAPNWRPAVLCIPYLLLLATISLGLGATQESILRRSQQKNKLMEFESLNDISVPKYFLWRYFPTMVMVFYGVAYQMVDIEAKRVEPWYRLAQKNGATVTQSLNVDGTNFWTWFRPPFPGSARTRLSTIISFLAVAVAPIIQNATLSVRPSANGAFALYVESVWSRSLTAVLVFVGIITVALLYPLRHRTGLLADSGGISGLLGMCTRSHILADFANLDVRLSDKEIGNILSHRRYILHKGSLWQGEYIRESVDIDRSSQLDDVKPRDHPFTLPLSQGLPSFIFMLVLLALVPILIFTPANIVLDKLPFLMTALGITVRLLWTLFDTNIRLTEPYYHLVRRNAIPNVLTVDYTGTVSFALPFKAWKERHHTLALVSMNSILLDVLTVCLSSFSTKGAHFMHRKSTAPAANILEGDAETFRSFWISLFLSLLILLSLCATAVFVYLQRHDVSLPRKPGSLAFVLLVTHQSKTLYNFVDVEKFNKAQRLAHLLNLNKRYGFGWFKGRDGEMHCGIDEEPLMYSYKAEQNPKYSIVQASEIGGWERY